MLPGIAIANLILIGLALSVTSTDGQQVGFQSSYMPAVYEDAGDPHFKSNVDQAMSCLKESYPEYYLSVSYWIKEIRPTDTYTRINNHGICYINKNDSRASHYWLAGVLIHEARHVEDDNTYFLHHDYSPEISEKSALTVQAEFLGSLNGWTDEQEQNWINKHFMTRYWETIPAKYNK